LKTPLNLKQASKQAGDKRKIGFQFFFMEISLMHTRATEKAVKYFMRIHKIVGDELFSSSSSSSFL
jgi:hypothetical protein